MFAEPSFSHNTLWRRLRRRYLVDYLSLLSPFLFCPPAICSVSWLLHGPIWLTISCGVLWALISLGAGFFATFSLILLMHWGTPREYPVPNRLMVAWHLLICGGMLVALLMGRVDWAFYISFGVSPLGGLSKMWPLSLRNALPLMLGAALCVAFAKHAAGIVVSLLLLDYLRQLCVHPTLREALARRSTRAEYVARIRDINGRHCKGSTESLLRAECETEQWEEALTTLRQHPNGQVFRQNVLVWKAKIYLGQALYSEVLRLEWKARHHSAAIEPYLAVVYARLGRMEEAFRIAEEARRLNRKGAELALGHVYFEGRQYEKALQWYEAAAQNRLERAEALRCAGRALMALGDYREAGSAYDQAIRLTRFVLPEDLLQLARCLQETHQEIAAAEMEQLAHEKA